MRSKQLAVALTLAALTGCASVSVTSFHEDHSLAPSRLPNKITVAPAKAVFMESAKDIDSTLYLEPETGHYRSEGQIPNSPATGRELSIAGYKQLVRFLPAQKGPKTYKQEIRFDCRITEQQKGSRALRALVGFGFGRTLFETKTRVFNTNKSQTTPWLEIWTSGSSNREPGAIFCAMPSPLLAFNILAAAETAVALANGCGKGLTQDAKRTGKLIGSLVLEKLRESGIETQRQHIKYLGSVPIPLSDHVVHVPFAKRCAAETPTIYQ
ncbi:MAG: DUF4410 domain-containing protein [Verrucomicrobiae bacterium]